MKFNLLLSNLTQPPLPKLKNLFVSETGRDIFSNQQLLVANWNPDQKWQNFFCQWLGGDRRYKCAKVLPSMKLGVRNVLSLHVCFFSVCLEDIWFGRQVVSLHFLPTSGLETSASRFQFNEGEIQQQREMKQKRERAKQCYQMVIFLFNLWPFTTVTICPMA